MNSEKFNTAVRKAFEQDPTECHRQLSLLHESIMQQYTRAVRNITAARAAQASSDGRSIAQVVGHIAEWDRYLILSAGEILSGLESPRIIHEEGFLDEDGKPVSFEGIDAFNALQASRLATWPWEKIQSLAVRSSTVLYTIFTHPYLLSGGVLNRTRPYELRYADGYRKSTTEGWFLWLINLEHEGVEHAADLGMDVRI